MTDRGARLNPTKDQAPVTTMALADAPVGVILRSTFPMPVRAGAYPKTAIFKINDDRVERQLWARIRNSEILMQSAAKGAFLRSGNPITEQPSRIHPYFRRPSNSHMR